MENGVFSLIEQLLKIARDFKDSPGNASEQLSSLREETEKNKGLSETFAPLMPHVNLEVQDVSVQCLNWTFLLSTCLTQLDRKSPLSVQQENNSQSLLTLLVTLGVNPNLLATLQTKRQGSAAEEPNTGLGHQRLVTSMALLLRVGFASQLGPGLLQRHLVDVLAALCQLCHAPICKVNAEQETAEEADESSEFISQAVDEGTLGSFANLLRMIKEVEESPLPAEKLVVEMEAGRRVMQRYLDRLQSFLYQPLLVQALLSLQNMKRKSCPIWLRSCCGRMLTSALLRTPTGLANVLHGMLQDLSPTSETCPDIVRARAGAIARLLCQTPAQCASAKEYLTLIGPQVIGILSAPDVSTECVLSQIACNFLANLHVSQQELAQECLFLPLLAPLVGLVDQEQQQQQEEGEEEETADTVLLSSADLDTCLNTIHRVFECCGDNACILAEPLLLPVSGLLFELTVASGASHYRTRTLELLHTLLSSLEEPDALDWLEQVILSPIQHVQFRRTPSGDMEAATPQANQEAEALAAVGARMEILWSLVERNSYLQQPFFVRLLQMVCKQKSDDTDPCKSLVLLLLVERMAEAVEPERLLKDLGRTVQVLQTMLTHYLIMSRDADSEDEATEFNVETPLLAFTILGLILQHRKLSGEDWQSLQRLLPTLDEMSGYSPLTSSTRDLAQQLRVTIATRGVVAAAQVVPGGGACGGAEGGEEKEEETFVCAWRHLLDAQVAFKCHGLVLLRRLLLRKDSETLQHRQIILDTLRHEHLLHQDSCVYQSCIQALVALSASHPREVLAMLMDAYSSTRQVQEDTRLKVAEALVQISRQIPGVLSRQEQAALLTSFLAACRAGSPVMRLSALSCLGELCAVMRFDVCCQLQEVLLCILSFLTCEGDVELKRASAMALTQFFRGLGKDMFQVLKDNLRDVHRALRHTKAKEKDERLLLHVDLALEEIKESVRQSLPDPNVLQKDIKVLDPL